MKATIHPKWFKDAKITCACGNTFTVGATVPEIQVEVCSKCHPFYTGEQRFVDSASRIQKFQTKQKASEGYVSKAIKKQRELAAKKSETGPKSLREMLANLG